MTAPSRLKNRLIAKLITRFPALADRFAAAYRPHQTIGVPWTALTKPLNECVIALVTTAGVHHRDQPPFDMQDRDGDPSCRVIDTTRPLSTLVITHDYYDHADADRDLNIVFPFERLKEFERDGIVGRVADRHYGFMGHIIGRHIPTLINKTAPEVSQLLKKDLVDVVLLTPG